MPETSSELPPIYSVDPVGHGRRAKHHHVEADDQSTGVLPGMESEPEQLDLPLEGSLPTESDEPITSHRHAKPVSDKGLPRERD